MIADNKRKKKITCFRFLKKKILWTARVLKIIESVISITVPRGQTNPQKNRPKIRLMTRITRAKRALVMIVLKAILVISRTSGSKRKKMF